MERSDSEVSTVPEIRPEQTADVAAIARITRLAFDRTTGEEVEIIACIRASPQFIPQVSLVAEVDGQLAGHLLISLETLRHSDGQPTDHAVLMLGPVSVLPDFQHQGIGGALIRRGLSICHSRPERVVTLFGHSEYYPRFGFRPARKFGMLPAWDAAMVYPLRDDLSAFRGLHLPE